VPEQQQRQKLAPLCDYLASLTGPPDLTLIEDLLTDLDLTREDLAPHVRFNRTSEHYRRTRVASSGWYELLVVCWAPGQRSAIHDHAGSACAFRVIEGKGSETVFEPDDDGTVTPVDAALLTEGTVCASIDEDIHQVANDTDDQDLITLHLYAPSLASMNTYRAHPDAEAARRRLVDEALADQQR